MSVPAVVIEVWGKDHWSTFAYIETVCVDNKGVPSKDRMRCNPLIHPGLMGRYARRELVVHNGDYKFPTMLKGRMTLINHDDWSCMNDCEAVGLIEDIGTGTNPVYKLTPMGFEVSKQLRAHKANGGQFAEFNPKLGELA